ncbi:prepilin peptidase [Bacillus sp. T3]|uniref:prepilin peptidase n=1 Tax=Bacillus sp. T3 TaxID=467262 RepID=UPI002980E150|nr:prepilin peptidase [Bacillus sp. T3]
MIHTLLFLYGITLGSFYNVVGLRVPEGKSIISPRSACPTCGHQLRASELIPVLSYLFQKGKCRVCQTGISPIYPAIELLTGILFATAPIVIGWTSELVIALSLISLFIVITVSDLAYMIIPDKVLLVFATFFLVERLLIPLTPWWDSLIGAVVGFVLLLAIALISKGGMGGGDIKLFALIGFVVGVKLVLLAFFLSTLLGAVLGLAGMALKLVKKGKPIPFGPFIAAGTMLAYYYGDDLINAYLQIFFS